MLIAFETKHWRHGRVSRNWIVWLSYCTQVPVFPSPLQQSSLCAKLRISEHKNIQVCSWSLILDCTKGSLIRYTYIYFFAGTSKIRISLKQAAVACWKIFRIPKSFTASVSGIAFGLLKERTKTLLLEILICHFKR